MKHMLEAIATWPVWWANVITVVLFVMLAVGCFFIPRDIVLADAPDRSRWRDIRWWAIWLICIQLGIYGIFS